MSDFDEFASIGGMAQHGFLEGLLQTWREVRMEGLASK
jgi:hypothetical protein